MMRLKALGWGSKRIAAELGCARNTVRRWLTEGDWRTCASAFRSKKLDGLSDWIGKRFRRHGGNADVVRQELASEKGLVVSLRMVIGERVRVTVGSGSVRVLHAGHVVAEHAELKGRHGRVTDDTHLAGTTGTKTQPIRAATEADDVVADQPSSLLRPLAEYAAAIGGGF